MWNLTWKNLWKGTLKRETESLLIVAQNNATRINYIKTKINNTQENSKCKLCGDRDETVYHINVKYQTSAKGVQD